MNEDLIKNITDMFKTPIYLYDLTMVQKQIDLLKKSIGKKSFLYYSLKANPNREILKLMQKNNIGYEISSIGELKIALELGMSPSQIIFSGPGKRDMELEYAIKKELLCIQAESYNELVKINTISKKLSRKTAVAIRINPMCNHSHTGLKMTGLASQFGIDYNQVGDVIKYIKSAQNLAFLGVHVYNGTQILNVNDIIFNVKTTLEICSKIINIYQINISYINFGGGFGIPYFENENELDLNTLESGICTLFTEYENITNCSICIFESGRFLTAECGYFITKIIYDKESHGKHFLICDGGSNFHANSAFLGRAVRRNYPIEILRSHNRREYEMYTITGPLCTPTDIIAQNIQLPYSCIGDIVIIKKSGAYGITNSPLLFISHVLPNEIVVDFDGQANMSNSLLENINTIINNNYE